MLNSLQRSHLWNAALLLVAAAIALAADRLPAASAAAPSGSRADGEIASHVAAREPDSPLPSFRATIAYDPFSPGRGAAGEKGVAPIAGSPTVPASSHGRRLTAILVADDRRVAVIDDATVRVGDVLRDGAKVSAIQADQVWVVEKNGRTQMLTLTTRGQQ